MSEADEGVPWGECTALKSYGHKRSRWYLWIGQERDSLVRNALSQHELFFSYSFHAYWSGPTTIMYWYKKVDFFLLWGILCLRKEAKNVRQQMQVLWLPLIALLVLVCLQYENGWYSIRIVLYNATEFSTWEISFCGLSTQLFQCLSCSLCLSSFLYYVVNKMFGTFGSPSNQPPLSWTSGKPQWILAEEFSRSAHELMFEMCSCKEFLSLQFNVLFLFRFCWVFFLPTSRQQMYPILSLSVNALPWKLQSHLGLLHTWWSPKGKWSWMIFGSLDFFSVNRHLAKTRQPFLFACLFFFSSTPFSFFPLLIDWLLEPPNLLRPFAAFYPGRCLAAWLNGDIIAMEIEAMILSA